MFKTAFALVALIVWSLSMLSHHVHPAIPEHVASDAHHFSEATTTSSDA